jgi:uncharacterized membrane protein (DUF373 family)
MHQAPGHREPHEAFARGVRGSLAAVEELLYVIVGVLLLGAAVLVVIGAVHDVASDISKNQDAVTIGVTLLDRILLALIVAELLHTLRYVVLRGEIVAEPFLFVGLIAVVRRILIITAELERTGGQALSGRALTNQLLELGLLGLLTLTLAIAIYLVRRSGESSGSDLTTTITPGSTTAGI